MNLERLKDIKVILTDVDGVLTDGKIRLVGSGLEIKEFNCRESKTLVGLLGQVGVSVSMVTGRISPATDRRAKEMGIECYPKSDIVKYKDGICGYRAFIRDYFQCSLHEVLYIGDDMSDLYFMAGSGVKVCPFDALPEVVQIADIVTKARGGEGVLAEVARLVINAHGPDAWNTMIVEMTRSPLPDFKN